MRAVWCVGCLVLAGCEAPPESWGLEVAGLDPALLSFVTLHDDGTPVLALGGPLVGDGPPAILRRSGFQWVPEATPPAWRGAIWWGWAASEDDLWVVGAQSQIARGAPGALEKVAAPNVGTATTTTLYGVWGSAPDDVWIVGVDRAVDATERGVLLHYDGVRFERVRPTGAASAARDVSLFKVWGSSSDNVMVVGDGGVAILWDGTSWALTDTGVTEALTTVHGRSATEIFAVGGRQRGIALRYDGSGWTEIGDADAPPINGVYVTEEAVWVGGFQGYVSSWNGAEWSDVDTGSNRQFHAIFVNRGGVFGTGAILTLSEEPRDGFVGRFGPYATGDTGGAVDAPSGPPAQ